mmetsp:Transcript_99329/g.172439  ORF Transcript_99329/g.172439 Transcript_99329/m.172439 type:complete len:189 (+) Transcript_99329:163-729(+)
MKHNAKRIGAICWTKAALVAERPLIVNRVSRASQMKKNVSPNVSERSIEVGTARLRKSACMTILVQYGSQAKEGNVCPKWEANVAKTLTANGVQCAAVKGKKENAPRPNWEVNAMKAGIALGAKTGVQCAALTGKKKNAPRPNSEVNARKAGTALCTETGLVMRHTVDASTTSAPKRSRLEMRARILH